MKLDVEKYFSLNSKSSILYKIVFTFLWIIPVLPFKLKGIFVGTFILLTFFSLKQKQKKFTYIYLVNTGLYAVYLISLLYTNDFQEGVSLLETSLSLLLFPIGFFFLSGNSRATTFILKENVFLTHTYIYISFLLSVLIFLTSFQFGNYFNQKINLALFMNKLSTDFFWLNDHPIYLSIYLSISLLMICSLFNKSTQRGKIFLIIISFFKLFILLMLSRKGVIISFIISFFLYFFLTEKRKLRMFFLTVFVSFICFFIISKHIPDTTKRFMEVFDSKSYKNIKSYSSTSIRYGVYNCALDRVSDSWLLGYGVGDVQKELNKCYRDSSVILLKGKYNSHNQYLGILLNVGILGLFVFLISLLINLKIFYLNKDYFSFCLLLMFMFFMMTENILDRQNGVILFSFILNYYLFRNINLTIKNV